MKTNIYQRSIRKEKTGTLIPDMLSFYRIASAPVILYLLTTWRLDAAGILFITALATDLMDGYIARTYCSANPRGWLIDSGSDFILIISLLIFFYTRKAVSAAAVILVIISFQSFLLKGLGNTEPYDPLGKYIGLICYLSVCILLIPELHEISHLCDLTIKAYISAALTFKLFRYIPESTLKSVVRNKVKYPENRIAENNGTAFINRIFIRTGTVQPEVITEPEHSRKQKAHHIPGSGSAAERIFTGTKTDYSETAMTRGILKKRGLNNE